MANYPGAGHVSYEPLPLTTDEHTSTFPSPGPSHSQIELSYHSQSPSTHDFVTEVPTPAFDMPSGAAQPRFMGSALYSDQPGLRHSYASSQYSFPVTSSVYNSSVYALDPNSGASGYTDDPHSSYQPEQYAMAPLSSDRNRFLEEKNAAYADPRDKSKRKMRFWVIVAGFSILLLVAAVLIYFLVIKPKIQSSNSSSSKIATTTSSVANPTSTSKPKTNAVTGGDGSTVTMEDGSTFVYRNSFGGYWYYDENDPFNNGARPQSWSPALNETFRYGIDPIRGVNLGGWLVTEPFISPALYQKYSTPPVDEWTLCQAMRADTAGGGIDQLETHYKTFITEKDFAEIAAAGLNFLRIPIGYWAIEVRDGEQFLPKVSWTYFLKAIKWARKYGLRINLDLHALPGSQNGWNHSGRLGTIGLLNGPMGYVNAQRSLDYIRIFAEFISQPQYKDVVTMFGIINEPQGAVFGKENLARFYLQAYNLIRNAGGTGTGKGPYVSIHDGFFTRSDWVDMFPNADRLALDTHPYLAFGTQSASPMSSYVNTPCTSWAAGVNTSMGAFGLTTAGEFSNAVNDCALYLNNVGAGTRYEGTYDGGGTRVGSCTPWNDYQSYDATMKTSIRQFALSNMDALQNYFFWTWKIGNATSGKVEAPAWSYQLGLQNGWMPTDPRDAVGACGNSNPWTPPLQSWQTGGAGIGIPPSVSSSYAWPPGTVSQAGSVSTLPFYTPTGAIPTLPVPTFTKNSISAGNGWANPSDNVGMHVPIPTCTYLDPWVDPGTAPPASCGAAVARRADPPLITPCPTPS